MTKQLIFLNQGNKLHFNKCLTLIVASSLADTITENFG